MSLRPSVARVGLLCALALLTPTARAEERGLPLEVRYAAGWVLPFGDVFAPPFEQRGLALHDVVTGGVSGWLELDYRLSEHLSVGGAIAYSRNLVSRTEGCSAAGLTCSSSDVAAGASLVYRIAPRGHLVPWAGVVMGFEQLGIATQISGGHFLGPLAALRVGVSYHPTRSVEIGPVVTFAGGAFVACDSSTGGPCSIPSVGEHGWLTIGIQGVYDLRRGR